MKVEKLSTLLAKSELLTTTFKNLKQDYIVFFKKNQAAFQGFRKTYTAEEGTIDDPSKKGFQKVVTTVEKKLDYFVETATPYLDSLFKVEATNASGVAKADLIVDGENWGSFSSLELMRLNSILNDQAFKTLYEEIPVRPETKNWHFNDEEGVWEDTMTSSPVTTTEKEQYILVDPNINKIEGAKYTPQVGLKETKRLLGTVTSQYFSGEYSHTQRANILARLSKLKVAVLEALKEANNVPVTQSNLNAEKLFNYLHGNK